MDNYNTSALNISILSSFFSVPKELKDFLNKNKQEELHDGN